MLSWTTTGRPALPQTGLMGWNRTLAALEVWNGAAWVAVGGGGSSCLDGITVYDNAGANAIGGALPMDTVQANLDGTNYALGSVVTGAVTILNDGDYRLRGWATFDDPGGLGATNLGVQVFLQTTPSGLGTWANLIGTDGYNQRHRQIPGPISAHTGDGIVTISGGGGLDVQVVTAMIAGTAPTSFAQGSGLIVERIC